MSSRAEFHKSHPDVYFLDASDLSAMADYLNEHVSSAAPAGDGNMNYTLRVHTPKRSFIVKQARPWVEKYPHIQAPWDRALMEAHFYDTIRTDEELARCMDW